MSPTLFLSSASSLSSDSHSASWTADAWPWLRLLREIMSLSSFYSSFMSLPWIATMRLLSRGELLSSLA